jgi:hypothetical protein
MFPGGKYGRCVRLTSLPHSCAYCLEVWEPETPGTPRPVQACNGIVLPLPLPLALPLIFKITSRFHETVFSI